MRVRACVFVRVRASVPVLLLFSVQQVKSFEPRTSITEGFSSVRNVFTKLNKIHYTIMQLICSSVRSARIVL